MSGVGEALADAAHNYLGVPFRLHGRSRMEGVDCVGLLGCALADAGRPATLPQEYGLRNVRPERHLARFAAAGFQALEPGSPVRPGDVAMVSPGPAQQHLLIALDDLTYIHAHAGLRRVALCPAPLVWPIVQHWRLTPVPKG